MAKVAIDQIKKLREETGAPVMDCKRALEETSGRVKKAKDLLKKWGIERADRKNDRVTAQGVIESYIHHGGKVGVVIELQCETDFVAKTGDFASLAREIAMQVASMYPKTVDELLSQVYIRDSKITIEQLVKSIIAKLGENIVVKRFTRYELGENG